MKVLHRERSKMIHGLVDTLRIEVQDWSGIDALRLFTAYRKTRLTAFWSKLRQLEERRMRHKYLFTVGVLIIFGLASQALAGPSYLVECEDVSRGTQLTLFDANPERGGLVTVAGRHNQLPEGMKAFEAPRPPDGDTPLEVLSYKPYEVELRLSDGSEPAPVPLRSRNEAGTTIGMLERIVLENHSKTEVQEQRRQGAAMLILANGLRLRFNNCVIRGDTAVLNWEGTFQTGSSN